MKDIQIIYPILPIIGFHFYSHIHLSINTYKAIKSRDVKYRFFKVYEGNAPNYLKAARDHYKNFSEQPILFYILCVLLYVTENVNTMDIFLAWSYTGFKSLHSIIRFTTNYVPYRARAFYIGSIVLCAGWTRFAISLF